jgi:hypothetical protein
VAKDPQHHGGLETRAALRDGHLDLVAARDDRLLQHPPQSMPGVGQLDPELTFAERKL